MNVSIINSVYSALDRHNRKPRIGWLIGFKALATVRVDAPQLLDRQTKRIAGVNALATVRVDAPQLLDRQTKRIAGVKFTETAAIPINELHLMDGAELLEVITI